MTIIKNRVKVTAIGTAANVNFLLGSAVDSFTSFPSGEVRYVAVSIDTDKWQVGLGTVTGSLLSRGVVEENSSGTTEQIDFLDENLEIGQVLTAEFMNSITDKLDNIEEGATVDLTGAEIKVLYEAEDDTNAFDDTYKAKIDNIESNATADQIASEVPVTPTASLLSSDVQNALEELDGEILNHSQNASTIVYDPVDDPITTEVDAQSVLLENSVNTVDRLNAGTGLLSGGKLYGSISTDVFHIGAGTGIYVDTYTDPVVNAVPSHVAWNDVLDISIFPEAAGLSVARINILLQQNAETVTVIKVAGTLTASQFKNHIYLGAIAISSDAITGFTNMPMIAKQTENNTNELMIKSREVKGGSIEAVTGALSIWQEAGSVYAPGINWQDTNHQDANNYSFAAKGSAIDALLFDTILQGGSLVYTDLVLIPKEYDLSDVATTLPATKATIHRLYVTGLAPAQRKYFLLLGQTLYDDAPTAKEALASDTAVLPAEADNMNLIAFVCVTAESTDFSDIASAWILADATGLIGGSGAAITVPWGDITGTLTDQTDLANRFITVEDRTTVLEVQEKLTDSTAVDVDTLILAGLYTVDTNLPNSEATGKLEITAFNVGTVINQVLSADDTGKQYIRASALGDGSDWTAWVESVSFASTASNLVYKDLTGNEPGYIKGQYYYANGGFNIHGEFPGVTLQVGQEQYIKVSNDTGVAIPNGSAVYFSGLSGGLPSVTLAMADSFSTASVLGITTMELPIAGTGLVTTFGSVGDLKTDTFTVGTLLYLSSSIPGGFTETAPDIASSIGTVLFADVAAGVMFITINNIIALPTIYGSLVNGSTIGTFVADNYYPIENYTEGNNVAMPVNLATGGIYIPTSGKYKITANVVINFDTIGNNQEDIFLGIFDETDALIKEVQDFLAKDSAAGSFYPSFIFDGVAGKTYRLEVKCSIGLTNVTYSLVSFDITSVHIR